MVRAVKVFPAITRSHLARTASRNEVSNAQIVQSIESREESNDGTHGNEVGAHTASANGLPTLCQGADGVNGSQAARDSLG